MLDTAGMVLAVIALLVVGVRSINSYVDHMQKERTKALKEERE